MRGQLCAAITSQSQAAELEDLLSQEDSKLRDLELYRTREEAKLLAASV